VLDSVKRYVVGVVGDFYYNDFYSGIDPVVMTVTSESDYNFMVVNVQAGTVDAMVSELQSLWKRMSPDDPSNIFMQDRVFDYYLENNRANNAVLYFVAGVAVLLAAMGLYGLVSYNLTRRLKEFSVRKVFGANTSHIFRLMNGDYVWIVLISFGVGAPLGAVLMNQMLFSIYPMRIPATPWPYVVSITVMILMVALTISSLVVRLIRDNPANTLRME
jgi:ABC-type antimicrobial peptide transport system permease subunit